MTNASAGRAVLTVLCGVAAFAALVERAGLVPATFAAALLAGLAPKDASPARAALLAVVVSVVVALLFIGLLSQPLRAFASW